MCLICESLTQNWRLKWFVIIKCNTGPRATSIPRAISGNWCRTGSSELPLRHLWLPPAPGEAGAAQSSSMWPLKSGKAGDDLGLGRDSTRSPGDPPQTLLSPQLVCLSKKSQWSKPTHSDLMAESLLFSKLHSMKTQTVIKKENTKCDCSEPMTAAPTNLWKKLWRQKLSRNKISILILACQCLIHPSTNCLENCCLKSQVTLCHLIKQLPKLLWLEAVRIFYWGILEVTAVNTCLKEAVVDMEALEFKIHESSPILWNATLSLNFQHDCTGLVQDV